MTGLKDQMLQVIRHNASKKVSALAGKYVNAASEEKEAIQAAIDFEKWLRELCDDCL